MTFLPAVKVDFAYLPWSSCSYKSRDEFRNSICNVFYKVIDMFIGKKKGPRKLIYSEEICVHRWASNHSNKTAILNYSPPLFSTCCPEISGGMQKLPLPPYLDNLIVPGRCIHSLALNFYERLRIFSLSVTKRE